MKFEKNVNNIMITKFILKKIKLKKFNNKLKVKHNVMIDILSE